MKTAAAILFLMVPCAMALVPSRVMDDLMWQSTILLSAPVGGACATSDATNLNNTMLEGWTDGGEGKNWVVNLGGAGRTDYLMVTNADTTALTSNKPPGACSTAFYMNFANGLTNITSFSYTWDNGSTIPTNYNQTVECYIFLMTNHFNNSGLLSIGNNAGVETSRRAVILGTSSGANSQLGAYGSSASTYINVPTNEWIYTKMFTDAAGVANGSYFIIKSSAGTSSNNFTRAANQTRYIHVGETAYGTIGDKAHWYLDVVGVNTNAP